LKTILLYYPPNKRSVAIETLCKAVVDAGHKVIVLTLTERGDFHTAVEKMGIQTYAHVLVRKPTWKYVVNHIRNLVSFCKQHNVWSHLQEANIVAVLAQPFLKAKVVTFRHHAESAFYAEYGGRFGMERNKNEIRYDKLINKLAKKIIVPSSGVWYSMEKYEDCNMKKVVLAPYIYDFTGYAKPDLQEVKRIRNDYNCHLLLIMVSRMVQSKQHMTVFEIVNKLKQEGLSVKMVVMDDGMLRQQLEQYIVDNSLQSDIFMVGFRNDFINYMAASDLLAHPSLTEASNNVAKELGLLEKTVAVCKDVGDFNDYIEEGRNGFFIDRKSLKESLERIIREAYHNKDKLGKMGEALHKDVLKLFSDSPENRKRFTDLI
jgi:glycosyltransferase involved in cell wall biosynthesis